MYHAINTSIAHRSRAICLRMAQESGHHRPILTKEFVILKGKQVFASFETKGKAIECLKRQAGQRKTGLRLMHASEINFTPTEAQETSNNIIEVVFQ